MSKILSTILLLFLCLACLFLYSAVYVLFRVYCVYSLLLVIAVILYVIIQFLVSCFWHKQIKTVRTTSV